MDKLTVDYNGMYQEFVIVMKNDVVGDSYSFTVSFESLAELVYHRNPAALTQIVSKIHAHATKRALKMRHLAGDGDFFDLFDDLLDARSRIETLESELEIAEKGKKWYCERAMRLRDENEGLKRRLDELESTSHWVDKVIAMGGDVPMKEGTTEHDMLVKAFTALEEAKKLEEDARKDPKLV